ncbi:MAG: hypothetical protein PQJ46_06690, partial [Spirochaetales bacterium]|nr:hypothetical protein [Spirochaetales bacterium]
MNRLRFTVFILFFIVNTAIVFSEEITFLTINARGNYTYKGVFKCEESETENDKKFRQEILLSNIKDINPDIIILNG